MRIRYVILAVFVALIFSPAIYNYLQLPPSPTHQLVHEDTVFDLAVAPGGRLLASRAAGGALRLWDRTSGVLIQQLVTGGATHMAFTGDGAWLAARVGADLWVWDAVSGKKLKHDPSVFISPSRGLPGTKSVVDVTWGNISIVDLTTLKKKLLLAKGDYHQVGRDTGLAVSTGGAWLAAGDDAFGLRIWDVRTGALIKTLRGHHQIDVPHYVAVSSDGRHLASANFGAGEVYLWDLASGKLQRSLFHGACQGVQALAFSGDGKTLISLSDRGVLRYWDTADGAMRKEVDYLNGEVGRSSFGAVLSPEHGFFALAHGKEINIYPLPEL